MNAGPAGALPRVLRAIAGITVASGALLVARPGLALGVLSPQPPAPLDRQLFGTIGMFMVVSGGTLHHALAAPHPDRGILIWSAVQKLGASAATGIGVRHGLFAPRALAVTGFDFASGLGCLAYAAALRKREQRSR